MSEETLLQHEALVDDSAQVEAPQASVTAKGDAPSATAESPTPKSTSKAKKPKAKYYIPVKVGDKLEGKIKTIADFGAFVDLSMAVDGLVHISELSRRRVQNVKDVVSVGQEVTVWVKSVDAERGRIGLTMIKPVEHRYRNF